jgi:SAM-dependent methyltransferase
MDDRYEDGELELLHQTHAAAFRAKAADYRPLLPASARVVEVGSYAGGFLAAAAEWGWSAVGTDIGNDTARFCRRLGFDARCLRVEECGFVAGSFDAMFVWNCFEQLPDADDLLAEAERVLRDDALLVLRVPDADFYLTWVRRLADSGEALAVLAYNGLLGWPHRFGYGVGSLRRFVEQYAFSFHVALRRPVIRPRHTMVAWAQSEETSLITPERCAWLELTFRKRGDENQAPSNG